MSDHKSDDDQVQRILWETEEGLSVPRDDARAAAASARVRRDSGVFDRLKNILQMDRNGAAGWFVPAAAVIVILLVVSFAMYASQASRITTLENKLAVLNETTATDGIESLRAELNNLLARVEGLETRLSATNAAGEEIQALRSAIAEQKSAIAAMSERLEGLAESGAPGVADASGPGSSEGAAPSGGDWIVNLITVADPTEAGRMQTRLKELGVESRFEEVQRDGKTLQRLVVAGFGSSEEAKAFSTRIRKQLNLPDEPWITKQ